MGDSRFATQYEISARNVNKSLAFETAISGNHPTRSPERCTLPSSTSFIQNLYNFAVSHLFAQMRLSLSSPSLARISRSTCLNISALSSATSARRREKIKTSSTFALPYRRAPLGRARTHTKRTSENNTKPKEDAEPHTQTARTPKHLAMVFPIFCFVSQY